MSSVRSFVGCLLSFVVTAGAWAAAHRSLFSLIQRTDRTLVWLNVLYLLPLSLLPFGAALIFVDRLTATPGAVENDFT